MVNWLKSTRDNRFAALDANKNFNKAKLFEGQVKPFMPQIQKIVPCVLALEKAEDELVEKTRQAGYDMYVPTLCVSSNVSSEDRTVANYRDKFVQHVLNNTRGNEGLEKLYDRYNEARKAIDQNYAALIANVRLCKSAKDAREYLDSLGLDLSDLDAYAEENIPKSLALPVDVDVLGLQRKDRVKGGK
jgi:hypothetical protein